eukprot:s3760_g1.t1
MASRTPLEDVALRTPGSQGISQAATTAGGRRSLNAPTRLGFGALRALAFCMARSLVSIRALVMGRPAGDAPGRRGRTTRLAGNTSRTRGAPVAGASARPGPGPRRPQRAAVKIALSAGSGGPMSLDGEVGGAASYDSLPGSHMQIPILMCTFLIVSMQLGFAMLEVGCEHRMTVLAKNILDSVISSLSFAIACDVLKPSIVLSAAGRTEHHLMFLHWAFLSTSVVMSGLAYPILAESVWGHGDSALGSNFHDSVAGHSYYDYAGGGVVHLAGGVAALVGNLMVGRRILRPPVKDGLDDEKEFRANSYLQIMGIFNLWVGCYGFNACPAFLRNDHSSRKLRGVIQGSR